MSAYNDLVIAAVDGARPTSSGWCYVKCPICASRRNSLSVAVESGWWRCFRCAEQGRFGSSSVSYGQNLAPPKPPKPTDWHSLADPDVASSMSAQPALAYLTSRRVAPQTIAGARLGVAFDGKLAGRIVLPIHDDEDKLVGVVARRWSPGEKPYHNTEGLPRVCMPGRMILREPSPHGVYAVEGPFDMLPYWGWAFSGLGKFTAIQLAWIIRNAKRPVIFAHDGDAHREARQCAAKLAVRGLPTAALRLPPVTDPGEFPLPAPWAVPLHQVTTA